MAERIFVTGGAGYIGSVCVELLLEKGYEVAVYDNLSAGHKRAVMPGAVLEIGDLGDRGRLSQVLKSFRPDFVMHFAASCLVGESFEKPVLYYRNNVANGITLIEMMLEHGVKSIVFSSSCAVYGEPRKVPIEESEARIPINPYGKTKLAFESLLEDCHAAYGLGSVCLRYFNAAGATPRLGEDHNPETHIIPNIFRAALGLIPSLQVFGNDYPTEDGTCVRDFVHVRDLADAHEKALTLLRQGRSDSVNLGNGDGFTVLQVIRACEKIVGKRIEVEVSSRRKGDPAVLVASSARAREVLGWQPTYASVEEIIESAWKWHREHPNGYKDE